MAQEYKIQAVSGETRTYDTKFGQMISYKLKLEGVETPVELGQKTTTPAPQAGATLSGHIEETQYGPKFKKEQAQFGTGFTPSATSSPSTNSSNSRGNNSDPFTMYLSYAKDILVGLMASGHSPDEKGFDDLYADALELVATGGKTLYNDRPGAEPQDPTTTKDDDSEAGMKKKVADFFDVPESDVVDL